jgi:hypothetical protein
VVVGSCFAGLIAKAGGRSVRVPVRQPRIMLLRTSRYSGQQQSHTSMKLAEKRTPAIVAPVARIGLWDVIMICPQSNYSAPNVNVW